MSSNDAAISVENIVKSYQLGRMEPYRALRDVLTSGLTAPMRALKRRDRVREERREWINALDGVSFEVAKGEVVGLIGHNGAGKTTMLKILSRITDPTDGQIILRGRVGSLLEVGTGFHPELTGRENVFLNGSILGMRRNEINRRFDEIVEFSGVEKFLDTPVKRYSSGMQVRLAFAVAAHLQPEILLVDEVLAVGDAEFQKKCLGKMDDVTKEGRTVIFVSHNPAAIRALCPRSILLANGKVAFDGPTDEAFHRYLHTDKTARAWVDEAELAGRQQSRKLYAPQPVINCLGTGLLNEAGVPTVTFRSDEEIHVVVDYELLQPVASPPLVRLTLADETGAKILHTDTADSESAIVETAPGRYRATCVLPRNTFGDAHITISVYVAVALMQSLAYSGILEFDVSFQGFNGNMSSSLLRPKLDWHAEPAPASSPVRVTAG